MTSWRKDDRTVEIPPGIGVEGLLRMVGSVLRAPGNVQSLSIEGSRLSVARVLPPEIEDLQQDPFGVVDLNPYAILRNCPEIEEVDTAGAEHLLPSILLALERLGEKNLHPISWVCRAGDQKWWLGQLGRVFKDKTRASFLLGVPFYEGKDMPERKLALFAGRTRSDSNLDTSFVMLLVR